jgi:succinate dehydrogenase / fumarate reductase membrane anchor subunit
MTRPRLRSPYVSHPGALGMVAGRWLLQRVTAIARAPPTIWSAALLIAHTRSDHAAVIAWLHSPTNPGMMVVLLAVLFWHMALGRGVVIKACVHAIHLRSAALIAMRMACLLLAAAGIGAIVRIALQSP